jgi:hypothetical protein
MTVHRRLAKSVALCLLVSARGFAQNPVQQATTRDARWTEDVRFLARELTARHKNAFAYVTQAVFEREVARLVAAIPRLSDAQVQLGIVRVAALLHDGHTRAPLPTYDARLPFSILWLDVGPFIVNADDEHQQVIGALITAVNGHPIAEVADSLRQYVSFENELGFRTNSGLLVRPDALRDIGLGESGSPTQLTLSLRAETLRVAVDAVPGRLYTPPARTSLPLYRQRPRDRYWWTYVADARTIYLKYNQCEDAEAFAKLTDSVAKAIDEMKPLRVVVDLRDNSGGNSHVVDPLIAALRARPEINRRDALYAIMGRATFSSGLFAANDFRTKTRATLVGEPSGERANHYGEVRTFTLPNSGLEISYSTNFHRLVEGAGESFAPDVLVPPTAEAYVAGRDPAMEWILAQPTSSRSSASPLRPSPPWSNTRQSIHAAR